MTAWQYSDQPGNQSMKLVFISWYTLPDNPTLPFHSHYSLLKQIKTQDIKTLVMSLIHIIILSSKRSHPNSVSK